jgi:hypothetical protein
LVGAGVGILVAIWVGLPGKVLAGRLLAKTRALSVQLNRSDAEHLVWVLDAGEAEAFMVEVELAVTNEGSETIDDVTVQLDIPTFVYLPTLPRDDPGPATLVRIERATDPVEGTERSLVTFRIPAVHPNVTVGIRDHLFLPASSRHRSAVEAVTKDGFPVKVGYQLNLGWAARIAVTARDMQSRTGLYGLFSYAPDDAILASLQDTEAAMSKLLEYYYKTDRKKSATATILYPQRTDDPPSWMTEILGKSIRRVSLESLAAQQATLYPPFGYLPLRASPPGSASG